MIRFSTLPELSLYIHLPWCVRKCPYCDFNSHEQQQGLPERAYVDALLNDLEASLPLIWGRQVMSIFIGGGTPSLFSPEMIAELLSGVRARLPLFPDVEITMEANPGTFEVERFKGFREAGVNRLSVGVQSFDSERLRVLGRIHDADQAIRALEQALQIFDRVNADLMFGLPGQTLQDLQGELLMLKQLGLSHVSCYQLTMEPNTAFAVRPPKGLPDDDVLADMQALVIDALGQAGLSRYEISAFARAGQECRHNLNYWTFGDYLGIGAGAHGKISFADRIVRTQKLRNPKAFMEWIATERSAPLNDDIFEPIPIESLPFEFMLNALRLTQGVPAGRWAQTTGMVVGAHPFLLERLGQAQARGLMRMDSGRFQATERGLELLNDLQALFLP